MEKVERIFDQLDDWRHLPTYQLERRADIFFSLYLREILQACTGQDIHEVVLPEFPLHQSAIDPTKESNRHFCADYLAFSADLKQAFLIELKTDPNSSNEEQNQYLQQAKAVGLKVLLSSILKSFNPTMKQQTRQKRFYLLRKIESIGLLSHLESAAKFIARDRHQGFTKALAEVKVASVDPNISLVCIHPSGRRAEKLDTGGHSDEATFDFWSSFVDVLEVVKKYADNDPVSKRFAISLKDWSKNAAGSRGSA